MGDTAKMGASGKKDTLGGSGVVPASLEIGTEEWLNDMLEMRETAKKGNRAKVSLKEIIVR